MFPVNTRVFLDVSTIGKNSVIGSIVNLVTYGVSVKKLLIVTNSVWPSGFSRITASAPSMPRAPGLLSMTTAWPLVRCMTSPISRATVSGDPPAGNGTTMRICLEGQRCCASERVAQQPVKVKNITAKNLVIVITSPLK